MTAPKNYKELTDKMLQLFTDISEDKISIDKANSMVKTSNGTIKSELGQYYKISNINYDLIFSDRHTHIMFTMGI